MGIIKYHEPNQGCNELQKKTKKQNKQKNNNTLWVLKHHLPTKKRKSIYFLDKEQLFLTLKKTFADGNSATGPLIVTSPKNHNLTQRSTSVASSLALSLHQWRRQNADSERASEQRQRTKRGNKKFKSTFLLSHSSFLCRGNRMTPFWSMF